MNLLITDTAVEINFLINENNQYINLEDVKMKPCTGCYSCWVRTPGKCVILDDARKIYPLIAKSKQVIYVTKLAFGGYDTPFKTLHERTLPIQQPFIRLHHNETHHVQRNVELKNATIIAYGNISMAEQEVFKQLVQRNAYNMQFETSKVLFTDEQNLSQLIEQEVQLWQS